MVVFSFDENEFSISTSFLTIYHSSNVRLFYRVYLFFYFSFVIFLSGVHIILSMSAHSNVP